MVEIIHETAKPCVKFLIYNSLHVKAKNNNWNLIKLLEIRTYVLFESFLNVHQYLHL